MSETDRLLKAIRTDPYIAYYFHVLLWLWCADNPEKEKEDWPMGEFNGGIIPIVDNDCFACEFKGFKSYHHDDKYISCGANCLVVWPGDYCHSNPLFNDGNIGLFSQWENAEDLSTRSRLARKIANLPMRDCYKEG